MLYQFNLVYTSSCRAWVVNKLSLIASPASANSPSSPTRCSTLCHCNHPTSTTGRSGRWVEAAPYQQRSRELQKHGERTEPQQQPRQSLQPPLPSRASTTAAASAASTLLGDTHHSLEGSPRPPLAPAFARHGQH
jgi:hypothetical protein